MAYLNKAEKKELGLILSNFKKKNIEFVRRLENPMRLEIGLKSGVDNDCVVETWTFESFSGLVSYRYYYIRNWHDLILKEDF